MLEWYTPIMIWSSVAVGLLLLALGVISRPPSGFSIAALGLVEFLLGLQLVVSLTLVILGLRAETSTLEFFGYLIVALLVPPAAAAWALVERTRWSTVVLGAASLTVAVMLVRMQQLWTGVFPQ